MRAPAVLLVLALAVVLGARSARAETFDPSTCMRAEAGSRSAAGGLAPPPETWSAFDVEGDKLADEPDVVRALFEPTMRRHRALTDAARDDIAKVSRAFGYHLVAVETRPAPDGTRAVIRLEPLPMVRRVDIDLDIPVLDMLFSPILDDEVRRRMRVRAGSYMPSSEHARACELYEERLRIEEYLREEGYHEGAVSITDELRGGGLVLAVKVKLGPKYSTGKIDIAPREPNNVTDDEIRRAFEHTGTCIVRGWCPGSARFRREQHQQDIQKVVDLFRHRGYPGVRVRTDYDPAISVNRRTKTIDFTVFVDQRRQVDVTFEWVTTPAASDDALRKQLTFDEAASSDDFEANESARAITAYLQSRGYFDARVTWSRERFDRFDRLIYRIDQGRSRPVRSVEFVGNYALSDARLAGVVATKVAGGLSSSLFGASTAATSAQLAADVDRLVQAYRQAGYRDARVRVSAATTRAALGNAALTGALAAAEHGDGLHVRFSIFEGQPTLLAQVHVDIGDGTDGALVTEDQRALCALVLAELAEFHDEPQLARPAAPDRCVATAANLKFREAAALETIDRVRDRLYSHGRPRARVTYEARPLGTRRVAAHYTLSDLQPLRIGKIVIRGHFRTDVAVIRDQLGLREDQLLTSDAVAEAARRLRSTGLFDAVNIAFPDLETIREGEVNAVVEVIERYDRRGHVDLELGYSSYNGLFLRAVPALRNLFGHGISVDVAVTGGLDLDEYLSTGDVKWRQRGLEGTLRFPQWLSGLALGVPDSLEFGTEITAFWRQQDTPRFGMLDTRGFTFALSRSWPRARSATHPARALTVGLHYDFRRRERLVDVVRPIGADDSETQVPIATRTGSVGVIFEWEQRVDRDGTLAPLAPQGGFRLEAQASIASPMLGGQATFAKLSGAASKFWSAGPNLVLRADLRYDHGIPLGGSVLLPEVERFFAGGDTTVRGYEDDRLATEIIRFGVPPYDNLQQIRVLPAGGNIRAMASVDAQLRVWKVLATALFVDAGLITNDWSTVTEDDIRPAAGIALVRIVTPFGIGALERAIPLRPQLGDDPRGRWHLSFAARAQF